MNKNSFKSSWTYKEIVRHKKFIYIIILFSVLSYFFGLKKIFFISLFIVGNSYILLIDRYIDLPIDIEFSTLGSILTTIAFNLKLGIFVAISTKLASMLYVGKIRVDHIFMIIGYCLEAIMAKLFFPFIPNLIYLGIIINIIYNIYIFIISKFVLGMRELDIVGYALSNILFNIVIFSGFSKFIFGFM